MCSSDLQPPRPPPPHLLAPPRQCRIYAGYRVEPYRLPEDVKLYAGTAGEAQSLHALATFERAAVLRAASCPDPADLPTQVRPLARLEMRRVCGGPLTSRHTNPSLDPADLPTQVRPARSSPLSRPYLAHI